MLSNKLPHLKQRQGSNYLVSYSYHRAQRGREHSSLIIDCEYLRFLPSLIINCGDSKTKDEQSSDFKVVRFWYERQVYLKIQRFIVLRTDFRRDYFGCKIHFKAFLWSLICFWHFKINFNTQILIEIIFMIKRKFQFWTNRNAFCLGLLILSMHIFIVSYFISESRSSR